jgi:uncharacterized DUF497 family protein
MNVTKHFEWDETKNNKLLIERGIGFEEVVVAIQNGHLLGIVKGKEPNYSHQKIFVVFIDGYTYAVPFVEDNHHLFLKTIYPSRVLHKIYYEDVVK